MGKSAIIFGMSNSIHLLNFVKVILESRDDIDEIVVFNTISSISDTKYQTYYNENKIKIYDAKEINVANRYLKILLNFILRYKDLRRHLKRHGRYDYCFVLYCSWQSVLWTSIKKQYFKQLIPVFWGGDVLRNKRLHRFIYRLFLKYSYKIVLPNINAQKVFSNKTKGMYDMKTHVIQYPQKMIQCLQNLESKVDLKLVKEQFNLPTDKLIVICGHTATRAEQYERMITEIKKCNDEVKQKCYFVFMMTYAPDDYKGYQEEVKNLLMDKIISGTVFTNYIPYEEILKLHFISNIHITTIKTDAFSCFLQEELYTGSIIVYGKWLNYYEIENGQYATVPINDFGELSKKIDEIIVNFEEYEHSSTRNRDAIVSLASEESIINSWDKYIFH